MSRQNRPHDSTEFTLARSPSSPRIPLPSPPSLQRVIHTSTPDTESCPPTILDGHVSPMSQGRSTTLWSVTSASSIQFLTAPYFLSTEVTEFSDSFSGPTQHAEHHFIQVIPAQPAPDRLLCHSPGMSMFGKLHHLSNALVGQRQVSLLHFWPRPRLDTPRHGLLVWFDLGRTQTCSLDTIQSSTSSAVISQSGTRLLGPIFSRLDTKTVLPLRVRSYQAYLLCSTLHERNHILSTRHRTRCAGTSPSDPA